MRPAASPDGGCAEGSTRGSPGDEGSEALEVVVVVPVVMLLLLLSVQLALWGLAAHDITLAVADGGSTARSSAAMPGRAAAVVRHDVGSFGGSLVRNLAVGVTMTPNRFVAVSATGLVPTVFPGVRIHVSAVSVGPEQSFRATG